MLKKQQTIKKAVSYQGRGLHTGNKTLLTFKPAPENYGIRFVRTDLENQPEIPAVVDYVKNSSDYDSLRGTTLVNNNAEVHTVEHVLAAVCGLQIDNIRIELNSNEPPIGDGSAMPYTHKLIEAGIEEQNEQGYINHPPKNMYNYPFQEWWNRPDNLRIFALSGFLKKWGLKDAEFFKKVKDFYSKSSLPKEFEIYDYPYFIYLKYLGENKEEKEMLQHIISQFPSIFEKNKDHYPLFGRHWYHALNNVDKKVIENEAENFFTGLKDDGGLKIVYQDLPGWRPIWTLDGLIILKKSGIIEF